MIQTKELESVYKGSQETRSRVHKEIELRWGKEAAAEYDPKVNCFTLNRWDQMGMRVKKGEKGIKSVTFFKFDRITKFGKTTELYPRTITLFFHTQVHPKRSYNKSTKSNQFVNLD